MSSKRIHPKTGEWTEEHLKECAQLGVPPNLHPELAEHHMNPPAYRPAEEMKKKAKKK